MNKTRSYKYLYSLGNLTLAWRKARKGKTSNKDIVKFEIDLERNLLDLNHELKNKTYKPKKLTTFLLRDPKIRVISKSDFRDRIVHHALILIIGKDFEKQFIYDSCANQIKKGTGLAQKRFDRFLRKITNNLTNNAFCLKADIKHYFENVDHKILMKILSKQIKDPDILWLIRKILNNTNSRIQRRVRNVFKTPASTGKGMPLGNYTSQFFANVYLHDLDFYVKHILKVKCYIRYVDDFIILHKSKKQILKWKNQIDKFLSAKLIIQLHQQKSKVVSLHRGIDFVGFRNFYHRKLLRKRNVKNMGRKIILFRDRELTFSEIFEIYQGWQAYAKLANTYNLRKKIKIDIVKELMNQV